MNNTKMLTPRETEIMALLAQGLMRKEIGERLHISQKTVEKHTQMMFRRLKVRNSAQAVYVVYAVHPAKNA